MIDVNIILTLLAAILFAMALVLKWQREKKDRAYWAQPTYKRVRWAQIKHSSESFKRSGGFSMQKRRGRPPNELLLRSEHDVWNYRACDRLREILARYDFYPYRKITPGGNGYMHVMVKRRTTYTSLRCLWQNSEEPENYIFVFPPSAVLNLERAVRDQFKRWGVTTHKRYKNQPKVIEMEN